MVAPHPGGDGEQSPAIDTRRRREVVGRAKLQVVRLDAVRGELAAGGCEHARRVAMAGGDLVLRGRQRTGDRERPLAILVVEVRVPGRQRETVGIAHRRKHLDADRQVEIILLEYEASDRFYWVFSRNEDQQTYALELRVRHSF